MKKQPTFEIKRVYLSRTKTIVIFRCKNLSVANFCKTKNGYKYSERFQYKGTSGTLEVFVKSRNFRNLFRFNSVMGRVVGKENCFDILVFPNQKVLPIDQVIRRGDVAVKLHCEGNKLFDVPPEVKRNKTEKSETIVVEVKKKNRKKEIGLKKKGKKKRIGHIMVRGLGFRSSSDNSSSLYSRTNVQRPDYGGGFSPR